MQLSARGEDSLLCVSPSHAALFFVVAAAGCSDVNVVDDDASGTSIGGAGATSSVSSSSGAAGGGGAAPVPRVITLEYRGNGGSPIDDGRVLVSDADGTLREVLLPSELPAEVIVTDGQLVSFLRRDGIVGQMSWHPLRIDSFRVTPSVTTKIVGGEAPWGPTCDVEPMTVTVDFAEVPGDVYAYEAFATDDVGAFDGPSTTATLEVGVCDGTTFDVLAAVRGGGQTLGYELFEGLDFVPGGELQLSTTTSSIERASLDLDIVGLEGASYLGCYPSWQHPPTFLSSESALDLQLTSPPEAVAWTATPIVPGGAGYGETSLFCHISLASPVDGACGGGSARRVIESAPGTSQTIDLDVGLARPAKAGATGWTFAGRASSGTSCRSRWSWGPRTIPVWMNPNGFSWRIPLFRPSRPPFRSCQVISRRSSSRRRRRRPSPVWATRTTMASWATGSAPRA